MQLADWFYALLRAARKASVRLLRVGAIVRRKVASRDSQAEDWAETLG